MRIRDRILLAAHTIASIIDSLADDRHLTTDPECKNYQPVNPGTRLDRRSRGESCVPCLAWRAFHEPEEAADVS